MPDGPPADFPRTLGALLDRSAERFAERPAVSGNADPVSYARLSAEANAVASAFIAAGVGKGTRVGILMPNRPEWLVAAFAVFKTGAMAVGLNTLNRPAELEYALRHADVATVLAVPDFLKTDYSAMLRGIAAPVFEGRVARNVPALRRIVFLGDDLERFLAAGRAVAEPERAALEATVVPNDPAAVFFTSGSTATPKAVVLSHAALAWSAWTISTHLGIDPDDRTWTALPLFFSGGFCLCALSTLSAGGCVVLSDAFEAGAALEKLERERCTVMAGYNHAAAMVDHPSFDRSRLFLRKGVGGNLQLADRFLQSGHVAVGAYGMTETATLCCSARWDDPPSVRRTHGRPIPGASVRIVDPETGADLPQGEEGEIVVRSPAQMSHYYGASPADCFDAQGYFHTGDLGFFDDDGCLHFVKRLKDVIKTMGVNVAAPEVERFLESHPRVRRACVVGVADEKRGENVAAFVVPSPEGVGEEELAVFCRAGLASYKVPRHWFFRREEELPVSASGKIEKGSLRVEAERLSGNPSPDRSTKDGG